MAIPLIPILGLAGKLLDKLFPDPKQRAEAEQALQQMQINGELKQMELQMSAIVMEAQSQDKWTSRARPGFLYVVYIYVLAAIPFGLGFAVDPSIAAQVVSGVSSWLAAIPGEMWGLFGAGYLGYTTARSYEKRKILETK